MATLEKIRSKSVLLFVIIIVALLAFILGDFLTSGRTYFGSGMTVAQVGDKKVDYHHYQARLEQANEQMRNQNQNVDGDELSQNVINSLLFEELLKQEYQDLGLRVSDKEISEAMTGVMPHRNAQQFIYTVSRQLGLENPSGKEVLDRINNPAKYNLPVEAGQQLKALWAATEADVENAMLQEKFYRLVGGLFTANTLDAKSVYNDNATTRHISYVSKPAATVPDTEAEVTDADIKAQWDKNKNNYRIDEELREIDYIYVVIEPSQDDIVAGQQVVENALAALNSGEGLNGVDSDSRFVVTRATAPLSKISDTRVKNFIDTTAAGTAKVIVSQRDKYTLAKVLGVTNDVDSINVSMIALASPEKADTVMTALANGAKWADFAETDFSQAQDSIWTSLVSLGGADTRIKDALLNATVGQPFVMTDSINGNVYSQIYRVNARRSPVPVYDYAVINYTIDPSNATLEKLSNDLRTFISANSSADDFTANAAEAGFMVLPDLVGASHPHIANISDSRGAVKWVMEGKKGQVSPVIQDNKQSYLMAIAIKDIYDGEYLPWDCYQIKNQLRARAITDKKLDKLMADYQGKAGDINGYAAAMELPVAQADVIFSSPRVASIGVGESALQGQIASAAEKSLVGPVKGNNSVVVFVVDSVSDESRPYDFDEYAGTFNRTMGIGLFDPFTLLVGKENIKNNSLNFINSAVAE